MGEIAVPVAATVDTDSYGKGGDIALHSVFRIIDRENGSIGTGFLHKSGKIITAEHVVRGALKPIIMLADGTTFKSKVIAADPEIDVAVLSPSLGFQEILNALPLPISNAKGLNIGTQISTWGFPGGYAGALPLLCVGVLSGVSAAIHPSGRKITQWVVNAAFNSGNSGGPVLHIETGEVIGVVSSKLAPLSHVSRSALDALSANMTGFNYTRKNLDGSTTSMSEGQIVAGILNELRRQVQLVIGMAVLLDDLRSFLTRNGIDP